MMGDTHNGQRQQLFRHLQPVQQLGSRRRQQQQKPAGQHQLAERPDAKITQKCVLTGPAPDFLPNIKDRFNKLPFPSGTPPTLQPELERSQHKADQPGHDVIQQPVDHQHRHRLVTAVPELGKSKQRNQIERPDAARSHA
ncbi:hypothetical protein D3C80_1476960 [compost metagenome]